MEEEHGSRQLEGGVIHPIGQQRARQLPEHFEAQPEHLNYGQHPGQMRFQAPGQHMQQQQQQQQQAPKQGLAMQQMYTQQQQQQQPLVVQQQQLQRQQQLQQQQLLQARRQSGLSREQQQQQHRQQQQLALARQQQLRQRASPLSVQQPDQQVLNDGGNDNIAAAAAAGAEQPPSIPTQPPYIFSTEELESLKAQVATYRQLAAQMDKTKNDHTAFVAQQQQRHQHQHQHPHGAPNAELSSPRVSLPAAGGGGGGALLPPIRSPGAPLSSSAGMGAGGAGERLAAAPALFEVAANAAQPGVTAAGSTLPPARSLDDNGGLFGSTDGGGGFGWEAANLKAAGIAPPPAAELPREGGKPVAAAADPTSKGERMPGPAAPLRQAGGQGGAMVGGGGAGGGRRQGSISNSRYTASYGVYFPLHAMGNGVPHPMASKGVGPAIMNGLRTSNPLSDSSSAANSNLAQREARLRQELEKARGQQVREGGGDDDKGKGGKADAAAA
ncbi:unnamed protein product, partial [Scytosiphon promiscuus]